MASVTHDFTAGPVLDYDLSSVPPRPAVGAGAYDAPGTRAGTRRSIEAVEADAPAHWASALVNGDWSGLTHGEAIAARAWLDRLGTTAHVVDCGEEWPGTYRPAFGSPVLCTMLTYTALIEV